ncbi:MAG TPA: serine protease [Paracoccaceae bacterium]|nr:serine protease [Paracoccaceae bacterium]
MRRTLSLATALALLATLPVQAQTGFSGAPAAADPALASPYAFAKSGKREERAKAAEASGARIVGGQESEPGKWPWQVALLFNGGPVSANAQFCGGSMLLDEWVLTAAHCVHMADESGNWGDLRPEALSVFVGSNIIAQGRGDVVPVRQIFVHPEYVGTAFDNDIALIRLDRAPTAPYATIKVPDAAFGDYLDQPGVVTVVTGWGLTEGGGNPSALREVEIQMMDRDLCNAALMEGRAEEAGKGFGYAVDVFGLAYDDALPLWQELMARAPQPMSGNMLCSGTFEGGKSACSGDSGGPLVVALEDGSYIQAGVVSWGLSGEGGKGCAETAPFSAYTRVSNYLPWLESTIGANP